MKAMIGQKLGVNLTISMTTNLYVEDQTVHGESQKDNSLTESSFL